jgi:hypothetical protein
MALAAGVAAMSHGDDCSFSALPASGPAPMKPHSSRTILAALVLATAAVGLLPADAAAKKRKRPPTDQVRVEYVVPKNPEHMAIYQRMKEIRVLEHIRFFLSPFRFPRKLMLKVVGCDGIVNAYDEDGVVSVCYEYIAEAIRNAPTETTAGVTPEDAITGPIVEVFLHEIGHAIFDLLKLPVLGREEDAADLLAAYVLLQMGPKDARRLIGGVALMYAREASQKMVKLQDFSDSHGLPAQRFYNLLCMAYGAHPEAFGDAVKKEYLPEKRAEYCEDEYQQLLFAVEKLVKPHMDKKLAAKTAAKMRDGTWLQPLTPTLPKR